MYADNVALPAFTRRTPLLQQSIDIFYTPPGQQQQTRHTGQTNGQTERSFFGCE